MNENPFGMVAVLQQGDGISKTVAGLLLLMSVLSWTVILRRSLIWWRLQAALKAAPAFWHAQSFASGLVTLHTAALGGGARDPFYFLATQGQQALQHHASHQQDLHGSLPLADWLTASLKGAIDESAEQLQKGLAILASVGSVAPFVGLFGTVWGIYHALIGMSVQGGATLDKIAAPVGEALIMTAFGLAVAIPATLAFNTFNRANRSTIGRLNRFAFQLHAYFITGSSMQATPATAASSANASMPEPAPRSS